MAERADQPSAQERSDAETAYLLRSRAGAARLRSSIADARAGRVQTHDLIDPDAPSGEEPAR